MTNDQTHTPPAVQTQPTTCPDYGEPWQTSTYDHYTDDGEGFEALEVLDAIRDRGSAPVIASVLVSSIATSRAVVCVNACVGMPDPEAELRRLRESDAVCSRVLGALHRAAATLGIGVVGQNIEDVVLGRLADLMDENMPGQEYRDAAKQAHLPLDAQAQAGDGAA